MAKGPPLKVIDDKTFEQVMSRLQDGEPLSQIAPSITIGYLVLKRNIVERIGEKAYRDIVHAIRLQTPPWNKGLKGFGVEWLQQHQFKKGDMRGMGARNWVPVGTIVTWLRHERSLGRHRKTGLQVKIPIKYIKWTDDAHVHASRRWMRYSNWLWEQEHGPIPEGKVLVHLDMDLSNDDMDNLMVMSRPEMFAYLSSRFEKYERRRRKAISRAKTGHRKMSARTITVRHCSQCSYDVHRSVEQCPKCGSWSIEELMVSQREIA